MAGQFAGIISLIAQTRAGASQAIRDSKRVEDQYTRSNRAMAAASGILGKKAGLAGAAVGGLGGAVGLATTALSAGAVAVSAYTAKQLKANDAIGKMATNTGLSTESIQRLSHAAKLGGVDIQTFMAGYKRLSRVILEAERGAGEAVRALEHVGLTFEDLKNKSPEEQLKAVAKGLTEIDDESRRYAVAQLLLEEGGGRLIATLKDLDKHMASLDPGAIVSEDVIRRSEKFNDEMEILKQRLTAVGKDAFENLLLPAAESLVPLLEGAVAALEGMAKTWQVVVEFSTKGMPQANQMFLNQPGLVAMTNNPMLAATFGIPGIPSGTQGAFRTLFNQAANRSWMEGYGANWPDAGRRRVVPPTPPGFTGRFTSQAGMPALSLGGFSGLGTLGLRFGNGGILGPRVTPSPTPPPPPKPPTDRQLWNQALTGGLSGERNLQANLPSFGEALGDLSPQVQMLAERAATLNLGFEDLTEAEQKQIRAYNELTLEVEETTEELSEFDVNLKNMGAAIISTDTAQRNLNENMPSYQAALGNMSAEAAQIAARAATLGISFDDLTEAEKKALKAINERTLVEVEVRTHLQEWLDTLPDQQERLSGSIQIAAVRTENLNKHFPSYQAALGEMSGEALAMATRAAELGLGFDDLDEATRKAILAVDAKADADRRAADAANSNADAQNNAANAANSGPYGGGYSGPRPFGTTVGSDGWLRPSYDYKGLGLEVGGSTYEGQFRQKILDGSVEGPQSIENLYANAVAGGLALPGMTPQEWYTQTVQEAQGFTPPSQGPYGGSSTPPPPVSTPTSAGTGVGIGNAAARAMQIEDIKYRRGGMTAAEYEVILRQRLEDALSKHGLYSPEEDAVFRQMEEHLREIADNTRDLKEQLLDDLTGISITSATSQFQRTYQTTAGTESIFLDRLEKLLQRAGV